MKEKLPNKKYIKSKKEIIDQVSSFNYYCTFININNCVLQLQAIDYIRELNDTLTSSSFLEQTIKWLKEKVQIVRCYKIYKVFIDIYVLC